LAVEVKNSESQAKKRAFLTPKRILIVVGVVLALGVVGAVALNQLSKNPAFCGTCHIIKPYYESWESSNLLANKHAAQGVECLDCHHHSYLEKAQEGINYITGNYSEPLEKLTFTREQCLECHEEDYEQAVAATEFEESNPHDSHMGEIDCTQCHQMHDKSKVMCSQCHTFSWFEELDDSWKIES